MQKSRPEQWSDSEIDKLKSLAGTMPVRDLEKNFQRSRGAILAKAFSLRLSLDYRSEMRQSKRRNRETLNENRRCQLSQMLRRFSADRAFIPAGHRG